MKPETSRLTRLLAWVQGSFSPLWKSTQTGGGYYDGSAAILGAAPTRKAPGLQGPLTSPIQDATLGLPRDQALERDSTQVGEGPGIPSRIQEV